LETSDLSREELGELDPRRILEKQPTICRPTGNPLALRPTGATVAGQPVNVADAM
jgi:hypothetical protein